ncbi:MAG: S9 family peptidase [Caulobacteraceae bacterium]|nr:S9 family peptidase [Caulobacteraceae bacterium]
MRATAIAVFLSFSLPALALAAPSAPPPAFPPGTAADVIQGVKIADPYRALENTGDPAVQAWSDAQNARTRAWLDALPGRAGVAAELTRLITTASPAYYDLQGRGGAVFALYNDPTRQQPALVMMNGAADPASRMALVDPNVLDAAGHTAIDWYVASPDGAKVAVSLSLNGSEDGTLHVYDVASGREIETPIPRVQYPTAGGSLAWTADSRAFWYTRYPDDTTPETERHFNLAVYFHRLGGEARDDRLALGSQDGVPRTGEIYLDNRTGADAALASVELGDGGQFQQFVLTAQGPARPIGAYGDHVVAAAMAKDGTVFAVSHLNAPMGKILKLDAPYSGGFAAARTIVPESQEAAVTDGGEFSVPLTVAGDHLFVTRIAGGPSVVSVYDLNGGHGAALALPPVSAVNEIDALPGGDVLYDVASYLVPTYFARWSANSGASEKTALDRTSPISYADTEVVRVFAASKDGTKVPVNIIRKKGTALTGANPTLLTGYGGYGVNLTPSFAGANIRLWLDAGGVWAIANLRGGGEYGEAWHHQGMLTKKQNVFDDFDAAGETLIKLGYTSHDHLALLGGSNGGLLMGATLTQHPALARAVVSAVGIYDMLRVELDPNGAFNVTEFGTVKDADQFKALYAYSPYHHVVKRVNYPAVLMLTGANDGRVNPMNSRKFAAALQADTGSDHPILLRTSKSSGHGIGSSLSERIAQQTDILMFLFDQLGMTLPATGR